MHLQTYLLSYLLTYIYTLIYSISWDASLSLNSSLARSAVDLMARWFWSCSCLLPRSTVRGRHKLLVNLVGSGIRRCHWIVCIHDGDQLPVYGRTQVQRRTEVKGCVLLCERRMEWEDRRLWLLVFHNSCCILVTKWFSYYYVYPVIWLGLVMIFCSMCFYLLIYIVTLLTLPFPYIYRVRLTISTYVHLAAPLIYF